jgi:tRNA modification GTPase
VLRVWTKADLASCVEPGPGDLVISALWPDDVARLRAAVAKAAGEIERLPPGAELVLTHERHADGLRRARTALARAEALLAAAEPLEYVAADLGEAVEALAEIIGLVRPAEVLDAIFARFCIGK